ncbi:hypothetical protein GXP67_25980 [Rhodocytophaga rosea]|uniref:T9SS type A sorting domain-containing protein n=1 Tax=Rhodocytophaga rosea TaxID=2704465 RepID=A0A6C0GP80_9BACT|nr:Ig-like domain-containing protein [Rhodocytophaga rosea]QHT69849.1 hypothetical protein GXP67_25980 [Rhodocytophaga rosea]
MKHLFPIAYILWLAIYPAASFSYASTDTPSAALFQSPLKFTENKGQILNEQGKTRTDILFTGTGRGVSFYLTKKGIIYTWNKNQKGKRTIQQVHMELIGASTNVEVQAESQVPGVDNYFHSAYPKGISQVRSYQKIIYKEVYPHIDFVIYTHGSELKYDFLVRPGGKTEHIRFTYTGNQTLKLHKKGSLLITNPMGKLIEGMPFTYQTSKGDTTEVKSAYQLSKGIVSFKIDPYDPTQAIVIDPAVSWATYYGGEKDDHTAYIKTDADNNVYVTGLTESKTSILYNNVFSNSFSQPTISYLLKFNKDHQLQWATYIADGSSAKDLIIDATGSLYLCGEISAEDISLAVYSTNAHQPLHGGSIDGFLVKFGSNGVPIWATYYGGTKIDKGEELAIGPDGNIYMVGQTNSENGIATAGAYRTTAYNPGCNSDTDCDQDAFIAKFNSQNGQRIWGTYFGGTHRDYSSGVASDGQSNIYICGRTISTDGIAIGSNPHQAFRAGTTNGSNVSSGYLAKFTDEGQPIWGTYYGNNGYDNALKVLTDGPDNIYIIGDTQGSDFITNSNDISRGTHQTSRAGSSDVFVVKFNSSGKKIWATFYGGTAYESAIHILSDKKGGLYIIGVAESSNGSKNYIATTTNKVANGLRNDYGGAKDLFIAKLDTAGKRIWGAYYGDNQEELAWGGSINTEGKIYIAGTTKSNITMPAQTTRAEKKSTKDIFIAQIDDVNPAANLLSPAHESVAVPTNATLEITFSEPIAKGTGNINIKQGAKNTVIPSTDASVIIEGNKAIINASNFDSNTLVEIQIGNTAFTDIAGNPYEGIPAEKWKFTTAPDLTPPHILTKVPAAGGNAGRDAKLELQFDEDVSAGTGSITVLINGTPTIIPANSDAVTINKDKVTITLPLLEYNSTISVQIDALAFKDPVGNYFAGIPTGEWQFTINPDQEAPLITSTSPLNEATNVAVDTKVEILFNEPVIRATGEITIKQNGSPLNDLGITTDVNKVTIALPAFKLGSVVTIEISNTAFKDIAGNYFAGLAAGAWQFSTLPQLIITPATFEPVSITHNGQEFDPTSIPNLSIQLNPNPSETQVMLYTRGISRAETGWKKQSVAPTENTYTVPAPTDSIDQIGLEYYFEITPPAQYGPAFTSDTGIVYINYESGLEIPLAKGSSQRDYRLISIPLTLADSTVNGLFVNKLGGQDIEKWRLYRYNNNGSLADYEEYKNSSTSFTTIETGRAYWILARDGNNFTSGQGTTLKVRQAKPYTIHLQPGWNLIGNPYDMEVFWEDVKTANATHAPDLGELYIYNGNGNYDFGDLKQYSGGFVWADNATDLKIPVLHNRNARLSAEHPLYDKNSAFEVNFTLESKSMRYHLSGLGMHPSASTGKDRYDRYLLPRFTDYLEIRFASEIKKTPGFTKQMVPVSDEYTWEFTVETNLTTELAELKWENYFSEPNGKQLYLYDVQQEVIVNMVEQNIYKFNPATSARFRVYYGSPLYISKHLRPQRIKLNQNVPNPFRGETLIPFSLPDSRNEYMVEVSIYNTTGAKVAELASGKYQPGFHLLKWNGKDIQGKPLPAGLYIARLTVAGEKQNKDMFLRLIIQ